MAVNVFYSICWIYPTQDTDGLRYFSSFYLSVGAVFILGAITYFIDIMIEENMKHYADIIALEDAMDRTKRHHIGDDSVATRLGLMKETYEHSPGYHQQQHQQQQSSNSNNMPQWTSYHSDGGGIETTGEGENKNEGVEPAITTVSDIEESSLRYDNLTRPSCHNTYTNNNTSRMSTKSTSSSSATTAMGAAAIILFY